MSDEKQIQKAEQALLSMDDSAYSTFIDTTQFNQVWRAATLLSKATVLPEQYRGKPENCFLAFSMSKQLNVNPTSLMQKTYVVGGKMGMEATVMIALVNLKGPFTGRIMYKVHRDGAKITGCTAYATLKDSNEKCEFTVTREMVEAEGWDKKPGSKWKTLPDLMYCYRAATFLIRLYCPEVIMGLHTREELDDISDVPIPERTRPVSDLNERLSKKVEATVSDTKQPEPAPEPDIEAEIAAANAEDAEPEPETPHQNAQDAPESTSVLPEERFYCNQCDRASGNLTASGKCQKCLSDNIVDRMKTK